MAETIMDCLNEAKWQVIQPGDKSGYKEYRVVHQHQFITDTSIRMIIQAEEDDPKNVVLEDVKKKKDPLTGIGRCEIKINAEEDKIIGIDVEGDIAQRK